MTLPVLDFIARFLQHVLPQGLPQDPLLRPARSRLSRRPRTRPPPVGIDRRAESATDPRLRLLLHRTPPPLSGLQARASPTHRYPPQGEGPTMRSVRSDTLPPARSYPPAGFPPTRPAPLRPGAPAASAPPRRPNPIHPHQAPAPRGPGTQPVARASPDTPLAPRS
jgi:hypothetical protein